MFLRIEGRTFRRARPSLNVPGDRNSLWELSDQLAGRPIVPQRVERARRPEDSRPGDSRIGNSLTLARPVIRDGEVLGYLDKDFRRIDNCQEHGQRGVLDRSRRIPWMPDAPREPDRQTPPNGIDELLLVAGQRSALRVMLEHGRPRARAIRCRLLSQEIRYNAREQNGDDET